MKLAEYFIISNNINIIFVIYKKKKNRNQLNIIVIKSS